MIWSLYVNWYQSYSKICVFDLSRDLDLDLEKGWVIWKGSHHEIHLSSFKWLHVYLTELWHVEISRPLNLWRHCDVQWRHRDKKVIYSEYMSQDLSNNILLDMVAIKKIWNIFFEKFDLGRTFQSQGQSSRSRSDFIATKFSYVLSLIRSL